MIRLLLAIMLVVQPAAWTRAASSLSACGPLLPAGDCCCCGEACPCAQEAEPIEPVPPATPPAAAGDIHRLLALPECPGGWIGAPAASGRAAVEHGPSPRALSVGRRLSLLCIRQT